LVYIVVTNAYVKVAWTVTSDARDKTSIESVPHGLSFVQQLNPVSYRWKTSREDETPIGNKRYGFLAQDILAIEGDDPVIIDNEQPENLKYQGEALVPVLVNAIKELSAKCDSLQAEINTLKGQ
jgi:trimeric autotransporter adhesin